MKRCLTVMLLVLLIVAPNVWAVDAGDTAPGWTGVDLAGREVEFPPTTAGQVTVIVFWATWCSYCQAFMPYLAAIQKAYGAQGVKVVAINAMEDDDEEGGDPRGYMERNGYGFITVLDGDAIAAAYGVEFIPGLFVIDSRSKIIYRRGWTELPAGKTIAQLWDGQVRSALNSVLP